MILIGQGILVWIGMNCIHRLHYRRLVGVPFRIDAGSYWFTSVCSEKLDFYAIAGIMGEIGLLLSGWDGGGMEGPALAGARTRAPPLVPGWERHH